MKLDWLKREVLHILDLIPLSTSSVAPAFSIAAAYGSMVSLMGPHAIMAVVVSFPFFFFASIIFRQLNRRAPHAGASYHWGMKFMGKKYGAFQFWIVTLAYFFSLPPIIIPAGEYTLDLLYRLGMITKTMELSVFWDSIVGIIWAVIAAIPLILGVKPTARTTEAFLIIELIVLGSFLSIGLVSLPTHIVNQFNWSWFFDLSYFTSPKSLLALTATMVIVATILDGWEIDSYASEESKKPNRWPGLSGIIGLLSVFSIYIITMPIMTVETPISVLSSAVDPLARWASYVVPQYVWLIDIAVIASTASSLWLTAFILSRAWYAGARDGILPGFFGWVHSKYKSPVLNILILTGLEILVQFLELTSPTVSSFFGIVLTGAGAFLLAEFGMDAITATFTWWRSSVTKPVDWLMRVISPITAFTMLSIIMIGVINAGTAFGIPSDLYAFTLGALTLVGIIFVIRAEKYELIVPEWLKNEDEITR